MKIVDYFDRVYVINLAYRKDRLSSITKELDRVGIHFYPGKVEVFSAIRPDDPAGFPDIGWRGCFLSHLDVIKQAKKDNLKNVLLLEDDILISRRWTQNQENLVQDLQSKDWGFVYFGHDVSGLRNQSVRLLLHPERIIGNHCYAINGDVFDRLIDYLEIYAARVAQQRPQVDIGIDSVMSLFRKENKDVVTLIASPALCIQSDSDSDLFGHGPNPNSFKSRVQRLPFGRYILKQLRKVKRFLFDV